MPQFDKITFLNQIIWLFIFFSGVYFLTLKIFLPRLAFLLKLREKKLSKGTAILGDCPVEINQNQLNLNFLWSSNLNLFKEIHIFFKNNFFNWLTFSKNVLINLKFVEKKIYTFLFTKFVLDSFLNSINFLNSFNFKFKFLQKVQINTLLNSKN